MFGTARQRARPADPPYDAGGRRLTLVAEHDGGYDASPEPAGSPEPDAAPREAERLEPWKAADDTLDAVGRLELAIGGLADADLDTLGDVDLLAATLRLERAGNRLAAQQSRALEAVDRHEAYRHEGIIHTAAWLRHHTTRGPGDANRAVSSARRLRRLDATRDAFETGELSATHVEIITRAAIPQRRDAIAAAEDGLVALAKVDEPRALRRAVERIRDLADPDGTEPDPCAPDTRRELYANTTFDGLVAVNGTLDQYTGEKLHTLLDALETPDPAEVPAGQRRSPAQRRHDAFDRLLDIALAGDDLPSIQGARPHVLLMADLHTLTGEDDRAVRTPRLRYTGELRPEAARHLATDASMTPVLTLGPWRAVNVGRHHRVLPAWLRGPLQAIHGHCRGPGCDRPIPWTQPHHASRDWADGADTDLNDTVPNCDGHHDLATTGGWHVTIDPDTAICTWTGPDGQTIKTHPPDP